VQNKNPPVALITGASRGLGRGIALELARRGWSVGVNYVSNNAAADETARACAAVATHAGQRFIPVAANVADRDARARLVAEMRQHFGTIDALVNNAGIAPRERADILEASEESFDELVRTNLQGPYFLTQAVARYWREAKPPPRTPHGFKVVFVTSISANTASVNRGDYCVAKAGLAMAAQLWAARLAEDNIQVVQIRPGIMATDMTAGVKAKYDALLATGLVPQRRWGTPEDVGLAVAAVVAGELPFSTGAVIPVDGGFHLRRL